MLPPQWLGARQSHPALRKHRTNAPSGISEPSPKPCDPQKPPPAREPPPYRQHACQSHAQTRTTHPRHHTPLAKEPSPSHAQRLSRPEAAASSDAHRSCNRAPQSLQESERPSEARSTPTQAREPPLPPQSQTHPLQHQTGATLRKDPHSACSRPASHKKTPKPVRKSAPHSRPQSQGPPHPNE